MEEVTGSAGVVHVACCFDARMEVPFLVVADSIRRHLTGDRRVVLHAFHADPLTHDRTISRALLSDTFDIKFAPIRAPFDKVAVQKYLSPVVYCRLMLPELLPNIDRVIYLDVDVLVLHDIAELFDADLEGHTLGAVVDYSLIGLCPLHDWRIDTPTRSWPMQEYSHDVVGLTDWTAYFNSGVLVMDLPRIRARHLMQRAEDFIARTWKERFFNDQDALNHVIDGNFARLDPRWNAHANRRPEDFDAAEGELARVGALWRADPWILHYCGPGKPWSPTTERTVWDDRFWQEAVLGPAFPLIARSYFDQCEQARLTNLCSAKRLFATGKPKLNEDHVTANAAKFADLPAVSSPSVSIAGMLRSGKLDPRGSARLDVSRFRTSGGIATDGAIDFDLTAANGHIVYGPYAWYPPGTYRASFDLAMSETIHPHGGKLVLEVVGDRDHFFARRDVQIADGLSEQTCALEFATAGEEIFIEFRIAAGGFSRGRLQFSGVTLRLME